MSEALNQCPFCGADAKREDITTGQNRGGSYVCCTVCQASSNLEFGFKENLVSNWNRRALPPSTDVELTERQAASLAAMVIDWVDGGLRGGTDWRPGLEGIILARLIRLKNQTSEAKP